MTAISITNLHPIGVELFADSESFMDDLTNNELNDINGGWCPVAQIPTVAIGTAIKPCPQEPKEPILRTLPYPTVRFLP